jgi:branched-chain amino acid transport system ATP-binding protein
MSLLQVEALTRKFGGLTALDRVDLSVEEGTIHGLMGANGAGKTTLFSIVAGNLAPTSGRIMFAGQRIDGQRPDRICRLGIARTFQIVRPFPGLSARENVETAILFGRDDPPAHRDIPGLAGELLDRCGLAAMADRPAASLTLAARKRLEVARALGTAPKLLLLDEVMAGLTPTEVDDMIASLLEIKERMGLTILIIEHVMSALNRVSDCITVLHHGQKIAHGPVASIAENPDVLAAYFGTEDEAEAPA